MHLWIIKIPSWDLEQIKGMITNVSPLLLKKSFEIIGIIPCKSHGGLGWMLGYDWLEITMKQYCHNQGILLA